MLPTTQFAYRKGLGTCDAILCVAHTLQNALDMGQEARIVQIDFSAAFDRAICSNHQGILFKLCSVGVGGLFLFLFLGSFLNSCGCLAAKSKTPPHETFFPHLTVQRMGPNHPLPLVIENWFLF